MRGAVRPTPVPWRERVARWLWGARCVWCHERHRYYVDCFSRMAGVARWAWMVWQRRMDMRNLPTGIGPRGQAPVASVYRLPGGSTVTLPEGSYIDEIGVWHEVRI